LAKPPELFFRVFFFIFFKDANVVPFDLVFTRGLPFFGCDFDSLNIFDFFKRHHFFFHISFVPPSSGPDFDDSGFVAFTGLLHSLPSTSKKHFLLPPGVSWLLGVGLG